jgi:glycosyltransferase involved in cell wall biosynthesis
LVASALRKIIIVNTTDEGGGAERMSLAVLDGFNALGLDTWLVVGRKKTDHPRVVALDQSPFVRLRRLTLSFAERRRKLGRRIGLEDFEYPYSHGILDVTGSPPDLVLCHNLHGDYFDLRALGPLSRHVPVAMRLFDTWLFSGHCAYSLGCPRWQTGCGSCPDLTIPPAVERDATWLNWQRKRLILRDARLFVSAESQWMLNRARQSLLAAAVADWKLVRGGIDLDTFSPGSREMARREWGFAPDAKLLLYVANLGSKNPYKDFATVRRAIVEVGRGLTGTTLQVLVAGSDGPDERIADNIVMRRLGHVHSPSMLAHLYRATDVYVHAAVEETFGNVVAEAMACGVPIVTASGGGVLELIDHDRTGLVVPPRDHMGLAGALSRLLANPSLGMTLGTAAAAYARDHLDRRTMIRSLHAWCIEVHAAWRGHF